MTIKNCIQGFSARRAMGALAISMAALMAVAQDTTTKTVEHGVPSYKTEVRNAKIVYVQGNELVLKLENGKVEHLVVPSDEKFTINGQDVTISGLTAGTTLTQSIITKTTPRYVKTVRTIKGKVWHVNYPTSVIVTLPDLTHVVYQVPAHATFNIEGQQRPLSYLRKGMDIEATVVTDDTETVIQRDKSSAGQAPAPETPALAGVLLIQPR
jgi:hypothetical protein